MIINLYIRIMNNTIVYQDKKYNITTVGKFSIWKVFPLIAFNELVFGLRKPKEIWTEINLKKYQEDRMFIPCKNCGALYSSKIWSNTSQLAYSNWYGLYCKNCHQIIPCVRNYFSTFILFILLPFTIFFAKKHKDKWLKKQSLRYEKYESIEAYSMYLGYYWVYKSWWNAILISSSTFIFLPLLYKENIVWTKFFYSLLFFGILGLIAEFILSLLVKKKTNNKSQKQVIQS